MKDNIPMLLQVQHESQFGDKRIWENIIFLIWYIPVLRFFFNFLQLHSQRRKIFVLLSVIKSGSLTDKTYETWGQLKVKFEEIIQSETTKKKKIQKKYVLYNILNSNSN